jgi:hypothetical protein
VLVRAFGVRRLVAALRENATPVPQSGDESPHSKDAASPFDKAPSGFLLDRGSPLD